MRTIPPVQISHKAHLLRLREGLNNDDFDLNCYNRLIDLYKHYWSKRFNLELVEPADLSSIALTGDDLKSFYIKRRDRLKAKLSTQVRCPYCGISEPNTSDHYLPQKYYPEFSIFLLNLIPCCSKCNGHKLNRIVKDGERLFLNCYWDPFDDHKFISSELRYNDDEKLIYSFRIIQPQDCPDYLYTIAKHHITKLKLIDRYMTIASEACSKILRQIARNSSNLSMTKIKEILQEEANVLCCTQGRNHYEVILYDAFVDFLDQKLIDYALNNN